MEKPPQNPSRRGFLQTSLAVLGAMTQGLSFSRSAFAADAKKRRHLINIVRWGGWDSLWFHNGIDMAQYRDLVDSVQAICDSSGSFKSASGNVLDAFVTNATATPNGSWHVRHSDRFLHRHPSGEPIGPGLSFYNASDFSDVLIWRGMATNGGHSLGNRIIQSGSVGSFASFSAIVAANEIILGNFRKLHYVQIAHTAADLFNQVGDLGSIVSPVNIPDMRAWTSVTTPESNDFSSDKRRLIDATVAKLSTGVVDDKRNIEDTKAKFRTFLKNYQATNELANSRYATSAKFQETVAAYSTAITSIKNNHPFRSWFGGALDVTEHIANLSFRFALAEFLVSEDLSTVVDILVPGPGDFHNGADDECMFMLCTHAAYLTLIRRLKNKESKAGSGISMLDSTTVLMHTEFDRHPLLSSLNPAQAAKVGTGHWERSTSILMAGHGVAGGRILGDFKRGSLPSAKYSSTDYSAFRPYYPLPIDFTTGQVRPDGMIPSINAINPTIVSIFEATSLSRLTGNAILPVRGAIR
jgi:uncharacterized protein (DUF1501 family)